MALGQGTVDFAKLATDKDSLLQHFLNVASSYLTNTFTFLSDFESSVSSNKTEAQMKEVGSNICLQLYSASLNPFGQCRIVITVEI